MGKGALVGNCSRRPILQTSERESGLQIEAGLTGEMERTGLDPVFMTGPDARGRMFCHA